MLFISSKLSGSSFIKYYITLEFNGYLSPQVAETKEKIEKIAEDVTERSENLDERKKEIEETNKVSSYTTQH